jgi:hypothetical protein
VCGRVSQQHTCALDPHVLVCRMLACVARTRVLVCDAASCAGVRVCVRVCGRVEQRMEKCDLVFGGAGGF